MHSDRIYKIGDKFISPDKAVRLIERILELREQGVSQQETAKRLKLDRSFVSRLEAIGEIRKGRRVAVIGFPLANAAELITICKAYGLDYYLLLNNQERWNMVRDKQALDFFNSMLELVTRLRGFDTLIMITSEKWYQLAEALFDQQIIFIKLGPTPIEEDCILESSILEETLEQVLHRQ